MANSDKNIFSPLSKEVTPTKIRSPEPNSNKLVLPDVSNTSKIGKKRIAKTHLNTISADFQKTKYIKDSLNTFTSAVSAFGNSPIKSESVKNKLTNIISTTNNKSKV